MLSRQIITSFILKVIVDVKHTREQHAKRSKANSNGTPHNPNHQ